MGKVDQKFLIAAEEVRQLHARYTDAVWRKDYPAFGNCFAEDCEWRISGLTMKGRKEIVTTFENLMTRFKKVLINLRNPVINIEADGTVTARTYLNEQSQFADGRGYGPLGTYYERFVDDGDQFRFKWRLFQTQYGGSPDMTGDVFTNPEWGAPPGMPPLDTVAINHSGAFNPKK